MREIKFRVWVEKERVMVGWRELIDDQYEFNEFNVEGGLLFLQYTGLKDKNGVEIYEGDIVKDSKGIGHIGYSPPAFVVEVGEPTRYWLGGGLEYPPNYQLPNTEVIGNIYENPELLKEATQ